VGLGRRALVLAGAYAAASGRASRRHSAANRKGEQEMGSERARQINWLSWLSFWQTFALAGWRRRRRVAL